MRKEINQMSWQELIELKDEVTEKIRGYTFRSPEWKREQARINEIRKILNEKFDMPFA